MEISMEVLQKIELPYSTAMEFLVICDRIQVSKLQRLLYNCVHRRYSPELSCGASLVSTEMNE